MVLLKSSIAPVLPLQNHENIPPVEVRAIIARIQPDDFAEIAEGLIMPACCFAGNRTVEIGVGVFRIQFDRLIEIRDSLVMEALQKDKCFRGRYMPYRISGPSSIALVKSTTALSYWFVIW